MKVLGTALFDWLVETGAAYRHCKYDDEVLSRFVTDAMADGRLDPEQFKQLSLQGSKTMKTTSPTPEQVFGVHTKGGDGAVSVGAKALGRYSTEKTVALHKKSKLPVIDENGIPRLTPSEFEMGMAGAFVKRLAARAGLNVTWREEDEQLLEESFKSNWIGEHDGTFHHRFPGSKVKALIGDATSGGG